MRYLWYDELSVSQPLSPLTLMLGRCTQHDEAAWCIILCRQPRYMILRGCVSTVSAHSVSMSPVTAHIILLLSLLRSLCLCSTSRDGAGFPGALLVFYALCHTDVSAFIL